MQVWVVCLVLFFGAAEFYQWARGMTLPLPILIAAGMLLAIASNTSKLPSLFHSQPTPIEAQKADAQEPLKATSAEATGQTVSSSAATPSRYYSGPQLPELYPQTHPAISFTIRKPEAVSLSPDSTEP